jgi:hypothetical protein
MDLASHEELKAHQGSCVILDVRGSDEVVKLGNAIEGSVNVQYENDDSFTAGIVGRLPDKSQAIICH